MGKPHIFSTDSGEELVIMSRRDYIALLARAGDEAAEDEMTARIVAERSAAIERGEDISLPMEVWDEIEAAGSPVGVLRRHRGLTEMDLASKVGIDETELSEIESGGKAADTETLKAIARELAVPLNVLAE